MKINQVDKKQNQIVLQVELELDDVEKYLTWAYKRVVAKVKIPGFRNGKAPRNIVERFVGREALLNESLDHMASDTARLAIDQEKLEISGSPNVEIEELDPIIILKIIVPLIPKIELGDYTELRIPFKYPDITDKQVDNNLKQIQKEMAPWEPVDRSVQIEDMITIDVEGTVDDEIIINEKDVVYIAEPTNQQPFPGFPEKLVGLIKGLQQNFVLDIPEDYLVKKYAGKKSSFVVTVSEIKERKLGVLDDEFAKGVGEGFDNLEALRKKLSENLKEHANLNTEKEYREVVIDALVGRSELELPPLLIDREVDAMIRDNEDTLQRQQIDMDQYLSSVGKTKDEIKEEFKEDAVKRLRRSWVLTKLAEVQNVKVEEDEVSSRVEAMSSGDNQNSEQFRRLFNSERGRDTLRRSILTEKVIDVLVSVAKGEADGILPKHKKGSEKSANEKN